MKESESLPRLTKIDGLFIQCACGTNESTRNNLFTKYLLNNVQEENVSICDLFHQITKNVEKESNNKQRPLVLNGLCRHDDICLNEVERQSKCSIIMRMSFACIYGVTVFV